MLDGYEKAVPPPGVSVSVGMTLETLGPLDEQHGTFKITGWLHSQWFDERLVFYPNDVLWLEYIDAPLRTLWGEFQLSSYGLFSTLFAQCGKGLLTTNHRGSDSYFTICT